MKHVIHHWGTPPDKRRPRQHLRNPFNVGRPQPRRKKPEKRTGRTQKRQALPSTATAIMIEGKSNPYVKNFNRPDPRIYGPASLPPTRLPSRGSKRLAPVREVASSEDKSFRNPVVLTQTAKSPASSLRFPPSRLHVGYHLMADAAEKTAPGQRNTGNDRVNNREQHAVKNRKKRLLLSFTVEKT